MDTGLRQVVENINCEIEEKSSSDKLIWLTQEWATDNFREFISYRDELETGKIIDDNRNLLVHISADIKPNLKEDIMVKKFNLVRKYDKLRFCFLNSKAVRSLRLALALQELGLNTPQPLAVIEERGKFNQLIYSYFITEYIDYDYNLLDIVKDYDHPQREKVKGYLPLIADDIRQMHDAGIVHNDLHAGNILVKEREDKPEFYYIDLNRGRIKDELSIKARMKDLARFKLTEEEQEVFLKNYDPQNYKKLLKLMIAQREKRKKFKEWKRKVRIIFKK
ncbi:Mn2+-dependent serine/threonine protein kinase [Halobacteroides halobius DSM 5150]|uniref:Mn2+-dependent serine/threonine protein kinase n=1 Tax=Halobacteroides halobius (strain ATCC 35273 / DSM 5150 / MD-1) TaxID=748449 RepID=L0KCJ3_HALHC|nr:lipopolysaccharide kinase InaA family protein [Halobacteroides halobius]AGB42270.1 Mn2+-dependent serine/threonine protein kinase [Halobacteroides halobius DSM 5150]